MAELWCYVEAFRALFGPLLGMFILTVAAGAVILLGIFKLADIFDGFSDSFKQPFRKAVAVVCCVLAIYGLGYLLYHTKDKICGMTYRNAVHAIWSEK